MNSKADIKILIAVVVRLFHNPKEILVIMDIKLYTTARKKVDKGSFETRK